MRRLPGFNRWQWAAGAVLLLAVAVGICEWLAWPFLGAPVQARLSTLLDRSVVFSNTDAPAGVRAFGVRFLGGIQLRAAQMQVAAPSWSQAPHLLLVNDLQIDLRYVDLWRFYRGARPLRIARLQAGELDAELERLADGRASWQFGEPPSATPAPPPLLPTFGRVDVASGMVRLHDRLLATDVQAQLALIKGQTPQLQLSAKGQYRKLPLKVDLLAAGPMPWLLGEDEISAGPAPIGVNLTATVGRASLKFDGEAADALSLQRLSGRFQLAGPSLAAVGDPLGVTLPTTAPFQSSGRLNRKGGSWQVEVDSATIGRSLLKGSFVFDTERAVPLLSGRLGGKRLELVDLGPAFGAAPTAAVAPAVSKKGKLLPDRPFDLASLRAMDADVRVDIDELNLNTTLLEPLRPLRGHLVLAAGVLSLSELDARTADGSLRGDIHLDGRQAPALWKADLRWADVRLERWIHQQPVAGQTVGKNSPAPWVSGRLYGRTALTGRGVSTAEILASMQGKARTELRGGSVSHLAVEAAGIDIAEALGVLLKGDDALKVQCGVADLAVDAGVVRPRVMVVETGDSALWVSGAVSLASERLDLRAIVAPKDFSPLTLRTPVHVGGTFAAPDLALEKGPLVRKIGGAALLALINPFAALIPLIDTGNDEGAEKAAADCQRLMQATVGRRADQSALRDSARKARPPVPIVKHQPTLSKESS